MTKHHNDLVAARDNAIEQTRLKSEFLATASHELRTPMNGVIGLAGLLLDSSLDDTQRAFAEAILESAEALLHVVNETLDFSKLEAGKLELENTDFDLAHALASVAALVRVSASAKDLELVTDVAADVPPNLRGDVGRLRQLLFNLLGNAVKFTDAGAVTLRVSAPPPVTGDSGVRLRIAVEDTGPGISGDPDRLFQPYAQASATTAREYGGTGLGLAICAQLVRVMGGTIGVESHAGEGSAFRMEIPFALAPKPRPKPHNASGRAAPSTNLDAENKGVVLVVDDNAINRLVAEKMVERLGYSCDTASNGLEALHMLGARRYVAVLMDCFMPLMDGFDATAELRRREGTKRHTTVIAASAGARDGDRSECEAAGMDEYVAKPLKLDELEAALDSPSHRT